MGSTMVVRDEYYFDEYDSVACAWEFLAGEVIKGSPDLRLEAWLGQMLTEFDRDLIVGTADLFFRLFRDYANSPDRLLVLQTINDSVRQMTFKLNGDFVYGDLRCESENIGRFKELLLLFCQLLSFMVRQDYSAHPRIKKKRVNK